VICQGFAERSVTDVGGIFGQLGVEYRAGAFRGYSAVWQSAELLGGSVSSNAQGLRRRKAFQKRHLGTFSHSIPCAIPDGRFAGYRAKRERIGTGEIVREGAEKSPFLLVKHSHVDDAGVLQKVYFSSFVCEDEERAWQRHAKSRKSYSGGWQLDDQIRVRQRCRPGRCGPRCSPGRLASGSVEQSAR
jgi:hypothetical protein